MLQVLKLTKQVYPGVNLLINTPSLPFIHAGGIGRLVWD